MSLARVLATGIILAAPPVATAGGTWLPVHGVRSLARAGALVAGADDADALWLDPAGLASLDTGQRALMFDAAYVYQTVDFTAPDGTPAKNLQPGRLLPSIAAAYGVRDGLVVGGGLTSPDEAVHRYAPDSVLRFASLDTTGSQTYVVMAGVGYRVNERLRVGATIQDWVTKTRASLVTSACTAATCDPDDASLAMRLDIAQTDYLAPSGSIGAQYALSSAAVIGAVIQAPVRVSARGDLGVRLPANAAFASAKVAGASATLASTLPPSARIGVEVRPLAGLRVEAALAIELWGVPGATTLSPDGVAITDVAGGPYALRSLSIASHGKTAVAPSIGVEWRGGGVMLAAGYAYETSGVATGGVSAAAIDAGKHVLGLGGGYDQDGWQIGGAVGLALLADVNVTEPVVLQQAPLRDPTTTAPVNGGAYKTRYLVGGLRLARRF